MGRVFRNFDSFDGNKKVDAQEFFSGLREIQLDVTEAEAKVRTKALLKARRAPSTSSEHPCITNFFYCSP